MSVLGTDDFAAKKLTAIRTFRQIVPDPHGFEVHGRPVAESSGSSDHIRRQFVLNLNDRHTDTTQSLTATVSDLLFTTPG